MNTGLQPSLVGMMTWEKLAAEMGWVGNNAYGKTRNCDYANIYLALQS